MQATDYTKKWAILHIACLYIVKFYLQQMNKHACYTGSRFNLSAKLYAYYFEFNERFVYLT